jgi:osmoprotectant transport system ATP-binding protein
MISFCNVSKSFANGGSFAVRDVSLEILAGETLVLLGSSGSGKTTLLRLVNRLIEPTAGKIILAGADISTQDPVALRRRIGYVFQGIGLFPHFTVAANVAIVLRLLKWPKARRQARAAELLELVGLPPAEYAHRYPDELSGGQQQRVGVARALASGAEFLLMDEPFGALDAITRDALQQELLALKQRLRKTIIFVTHDLPEALRLGDRIAVMHQGRLEQVGTPAELQHQPQTDFVRELFGKVTAPPRA